MRATMLKPLLLLSTVLALASCDKPTEDACRKAIDNIQKITGIEASAGAPDAEAAVRKCRAQASRKAVQCMMDAKTVDDIAACEGGKSVK
jgi:hypothetical protein